MNEVAYTNEFGKPVHKVMNAHIKKIHNTQDSYELHLNDQYFSITGDVLSSLESITSLDDNVGLSIG